MIKISTLISILVHILIIRNISMDILIQKSILTEISVNKRKPFKLIINLCLLTTKF